MRFIRTMLLALLALLAFAGFGAAAQPREEKVIYHVTDASLAGMALTNVRNYLKASPKAKIVVVANGSGIDFLLEGAKNSNGNPYDAAIEELAAHGKVDFRVCANTLEMRGIDKRKVLPDAKIVPSGVVEAARLQLEGYAYLKP
jgi:intracellular sulfur oxidation DsrE/DsrF family protein